MKETELAQHFVSYLSDYDLYFEIPNLQTDIVAKSGSILMSFEVKVSLNFKVMEQAHRNRNYFHYSYVCVPRTKDMNMQRKVCEMLGIGILRYDSRGYKGYVDEYLKPQLNRNARLMSKYVIKNLTDYSKLSLPGASGSNGTTITPFKLTIEGIIRFLKRNNGATLKEVYENVENHYGSLAGAKSCLYQWIRRGIIKDFYIEKNRLYLSEKE